MLININSVFFFIISKKKLGDFFCIFQLSTRLPSSYDSDLRPFFRILQLCTRLPSSYDSDLGPFCSRQLQGLPSSDRYFSQKVLTGLASVLVCIFIGATFRSLLNMGLIGLIFRSFWIP